MWPTAFNSAAIARTLNFSSIRHISAQAASHLSPLCATLMQNQEYPLARQFIEKATLQESGLCHINAYMKVKEVLGGDNPDSRQGIVFTAKKLIGHFASAYMIPKGFEAVEGTEAAIAQAIKERGVVIVQGHGKDHLIAPDSGLLTLAQRYDRMSLAEAGVRQSDRPNHSVLLIAYSDPTNPIPGVPPGHVVIMDQDNARPVYDSLGVPCSELHTFTTDHLAETNTLSHMFRSIPLDKLIEDVSPMGGGIFGTPFATPERTLHHR